MTADELVFFVNGRKVVEKNADPETTLLAYLRRKLGLSGTKLGCGEGGCGACTVMLSKYDRLQNKIVHFSANACLAPICSLHHVAVTTVEGIGSTKSRLHPVQERIAKSHGSQCGFCTPGIVMSMYTLLRNQPEPTVEDIEDNFQGNLCRCTGYRPILQGFRTFARDGGCCGGKGSSPNCCMNKKKDQTVTLSPSLFNPEEFIPLDPTQEPIFPPELLRLKDVPQKLLCFQGERVTWIQASSLKELLDLKAQHPEAKLVVGNTEIGIEMKFKNKLFPMIICPAWIPELNSVEHGSEGISFGAACTLSSVEKTLLNAVAEHPDHKTEVFRGVLEQLRWFAGKQIKSVACIGGNIITASPISDLNPVFMASGAKLTIVSRGTRRTVQMDHTFFPAYRKTLLGPEEILLSIEIPYSREGEFFSAFKHASRREDDIAKVTCGMRVLFQPGTTQVKELALCYGGMADRTISALKTTRKHLSNSWDEKLLQDVCAGLAEELNLSPDAPGGMVEFRRTLTLSFFFKFYLTVLQKLNKADLKDECGKLDPTYTSATLPFQKDPPANIQLFQEVPKGQSEEDMVGRPLPHLSAAMQASGEAMYCDDIPRYENELSLRLVTSTQAHAKIKSIDTSEAQKVPGFFCFLSADDVPGSNVTGLFNDEMVFAKDEVTCVGHIIGAVVADTPEHAERAAHEVKITYEVLPAIITIEDAIKNNSFYGSELKIEKGDLTKAFSEADNIVSGEFHIGGQDHFYLETHCTIAVPKGEAGEMELFASTQNTMKTQSFVANMLGVPANRILVRVKRMGGGFGGKETRSTVVSTAVALAAYKTGRPVRCMLDRDEDMLITGGRHPFLAKYKVGFMKTGTVVALEVDHFSNAGNTLDLSQSIMERALFHMDNCYKIPNIRGTGRLCKTNLSSNTAFRGFGGPQGMLIAEYWMSEVAVTCGLPAEEVRRRNMYKEGDLTHFNQKLEGFTLPRCWDECLESSRYHARKSEVDKFNKENCWKKRGLCIIPTKFGISFTLPFLNQAGALIHVYTDGSVLLIHGGTEMGQGLHTKMVQVASRALKIPTSKIYISETSTNTVPNTSPTAASVSTDLNGQAIYEACQTILKRLEPFKKKNPSGSWEDWVIAAYQDAVSLSATGFYKTPNLGYNFETNSGNPFHYFTYGVACSEVEIDCLTGDHKNLRTDIVMDVGSSLNPAIDIGQVEGAFVQGLGLFTLEELHYSPEGSLHTRGPSTYKIPAFGSIPTEFSVSLLRDCPNKKAIYASKAIGEPPLFLAASIFFAIKDAVRAARAQHTDHNMKELFQLDSPATPEKIRNACVDRFTTLCVTGVPENCKPWSLRV
ncbi:xanthine dehydrogenase/oxidase isoform X1 [Manis pentadactyla]|uniref:xanthine dehydrogenase/oxidase isoform X1 n=2 Tax=Manis pentadactyla TaxID=143292 RepID=UPI00255C5C79|nr:xanthine dehydrogenase/oxidase isoform X1 [Manis pentadactyla]KAI5125185.1 Xanthine Dehydrogenase/Oxidase [Manis pentadactyla]